MTLIEMYSDLDEPELLRANKPVTTILLDDDDQQIIEVEQRDPVPEEMKDAEHDLKRHQSVNSMFLSLNIFRDFFLAAFSDGYQNVYCCGQEGLFPGDSSCTSSKIGPEESTSTSTRAAPPPSPYPSIESSPSVDKRRRRKKPLAIAVGYKYAEDMNGRPVVITPGSRRSSVDPPKMGAGPTLNRSPRTSPTPPMCGGERPASPSQLQNNRSSTSDMQDSRSSETSITVH